MDFKRVEFSQQDGEFYGATKTAKYKLSNPSDSVYFETAIHDGIPALIGFGTEKATLKFYSNHGIDAGTYSVSVDTEVVEEHVEFIAKRNDNFRNLVLQKALDYGKAVISRTFNVLDEELKQEAYEKIREFTDFNEDNDPYNEHEFGKLSISNGDNLYWKIDYYADSNCELGTLHKAEAYLVLTIMILEDY